MNKRYFSDEVAMRLSSAPESNAKFANKFNRKRADKGL